MHQAGIWRAHHKDGFICRGQGGSVQSDTDNTFLKILHDSSLLNLEESSSPDNFFKPVQILNIGLTFLMNNSTVHQVFELRKINT